MKLLGLFICTCSFFLAHAQDPSPPIYGPQEKGRFGSTSPSGAFIRFGTGWSSAMGDLKERFPSFFNATVGGGFISKKSFTYSAEVDPLFGSVVRVPGLFDGILGNTGYLIDQNGNPSLIRFYMRGYTLKCSVAKTFAKNSNYDHSGFTIKAGFGFIQHKIKMRFDSDKVPQLEGEYAKGYDRLTNGMLFYQGFGYRLINPQGLSFYAGVDFNQAFTQNRRSWNYSEMGPDLKKRNDFYTNVNISLLIPIFKSSGKRDTYFE